MIDKMMIKKELMKALKKEMMSSMPDMKSMPEAEKKVMVASDSKEGLVEGLKKAEDVLSTDSEECEMEESESDDMIKIPRSLYEKMMKSK